VDGGQNPRISGAEAQLRRPIGTLVTLLLG